MPPVYETKDGTPITFKVYDKDPNDNVVAPWVLHKIEAYVGGQLAGYLKISYIPHTVFDKEIPTVWDYKYKLSGWSADGRNRFDDPQPLTVTEAYRMATRYTAMYLYNEYDKGITPSEKEQAAFLKKLEKQYLPDFQKFEAFHVDKPMVDYIRVQDDFKRQGVATALYKYGARWLAKTKQLPLYASGLQQPEAKAAWDKMKTTPRMRIPIQEEPHPHEPDKVRTRIDYRKMASNVACRFLAG